jgi:hypothetical protein
MKKLILSIAIFTAVSLSGSLKVNAQILPPPPPANNPTPPPGETETGVPIDGGVLALLLASGAYGYRRMQKQKA